MPAGLGTASLRVVANTTVFEQTLKRSLKRMSKLTAGIFAGAAVGNFFGSAIKDSIALEKQVKRIQTLLKDESQAWKDAFSADTVRGLSNEIGVSATSTADAIYYMIGSGVELTKVLGAVKAASNVAVATNTDLKYSADFVSTALNAYGDETDKLTGHVVDATHATDIFFAALAEGKGEPRDLAQFISTAIPKADALGVSFGEVAAAMATATLTGSKARKVATGLSYVIGGLGNETKGVGKVFTELTGKTFSKFIKDGGKLQDAIKILGTGVGTEALGKVGGAETGIFAIQQLLTLWPQYVDIQKKVADSSGDAQAAIDTVNSSVGRQLEIISNKFKNFRSSVGDWFLPIIAGALVGLREWGGNVQTVLSQVWDGVTQGFAVVKPAIDLIGETFKSALGAVDWEGFRSIMVDVFTGIAIGLSPLLDMFVFLGMAFGELARLIQPVVNVLQELSPIIVGVTAAWVGYHTVLLLINIATKAWVILSKLQVVWSALTAAAFVIQTLATEGLAAAWVALDIAMSANPIGAVIAVIAALVVGLIYAWKTSETFRNIVLQAFSMIAQGVGVAIKAVILAASLWVKAYLYAFKLVLQGLGHLPTWLGGGKFDSAAAAVQTLIDGVDSIKNSLYGLIDTAVDAARALAAVVSVQDEGFGTQGLDQVYAQIERDYPTVVAPPSGPTVPKIPTPNGNGLDNADDAKKKADELAKQIKAAMTRVKADLKRIAKNTSKQTADAIKNNFDQLYADLKDAKVSKAVVAAAHKIENALLKAAKKRDKNIIAMDKERKKLDDLQGKYKDTVKNMMHSFSELGDITNTDRMREVFRQGIFPSAANQIANLKQAIYISDRFSKAIQKLQKLGLKQTSLNELITAGPEAGLGAAEGLAAGGKAAVTQVNDLQDQLNRNGKALGASLAEEWYGHGIEISTGLLKGLEKDQDKLLKVMDKLGDQMAASFKKRLGIHSPSKVFEGFGADITAGLGQGITGSLGTVSRANGAMAQGASVTFGAGSVVVNGVKNGDEAKGGMLTGRGIVGVLESRRTSAALAGTGS